MRDDAALHLLLARVTLNANVSATLFGGWRGGRSVA
jgi:hypothetical protein